VLPRTVQKVLPRTVRDLPERQQIRTVIRVLVLIAAAFAAYFFSVLVQQERFLLAVLPALAIGVLSIFEFVATDLILDRRFSQETASYLDRLQRKLSTTQTHDEVLRELKSCVSSFVGCDKEQISSTVHLTIETLELGTSATTPGLVQISDYTRAGLGGRRWRVLKITQGLVGRCVRTGEMVYVNFRDEADYRKRMVEEFGFTRVEADSHTKKARSYLAFPMKRSGNLVGVLYFFSTEPQVFPVASERAELQRCADSIAGLLAASELL
jgi:transcriptional regulator with GAF, ATPase, and Fis domain